MSIFPFFQDTEAAVATQTNLTLPLYKEAAWDFDLNIPKTKNGDFLFTTGADAVKTWIFKALKTERFRYEIYSFAFGNDLERLIGKGYSADLTKAEAVRYIEDTLLINPYIKDLSNIVIQFDNGRLTITADVHTIYHNVKIDRLVV